MPSSPDDLTPRITDLEKRQADLERRIADLEKAPKGWPWTVPTVPTPSWPNAEDARCHVCQNRYADMTHYVCNHDRCPSRVTYCGDPLPGQPGHVSITCGNSTLENRRE